MEFDFAEIEESNKKAKDEFVSYTLAMAKAKIQFLAENCETLTPKEISKHLKELGDCGKILARHK